MVNAIQNLIHRINKNPEAFWVADLTNSFYLKQDFTRKFSQHHHRPLLA